MLEIMRDSRIGTYGVVALIFSVGLRWAALAALVPSAGALALVLAGGIGRTAMVPATAFLHYARSDGAGSDIAEGAGPVEIVVALGSALALAWIGGWAGLLALALGVTASALVIGAMERRVGGYTGDVLGASAQVGEVVVLLVLAGAWSGAWAGVGAGAWGTL